MNAIEILGSLLGGGNRSSGNNRGGDILSDLLGGGQRPAPSSRRQPPSRNDGQASVSELEDMLGVGRDAPPAQRQAPSSPPPRSEPPRANPPQSPQRRELPADIFGQRQRQSPQINLAIPKPAALSQQDQAVLLIRAMISSAKIDGEITQDEQQQILDQVGDTSPETIQFLRSEFAKPLDMAEFADSIPLGMEQNVYLISLMAIKLDTKEEADYLRALAKALRLSPDDVNALHQQQNAPLVYR